MPRFSIISRSHARILIIFLATVSLVITSSATRAQTAGPSQSTSAVKPLEFDVVSVKQNKDGLIVLGEGVIGRFAVTKILRDGFTSQNITAKALIATAYGLKEYLVIGGPSWIDSIHYDVEGKITDFDALNSTQPAGLANPSQPTTALNLPQSAKAVDPPQLTKPQRGQMMRSLLADRFKLVARYDTKDGSTYDLVIVKGGPKLKEFTTDSAGHNQLKEPATAPPLGLKMTAQGHLTGQRVSMAHLIDTLSQLLQSTIVDKTGLTGEYIMDIQYAPEATESPDTSGASIFTALQEQLGLKLVPSRGPIKTVVIDHIEQPSGN
jgi:uncharacterized protein (TIGR03435 family)